MVRRWRETEGGFTLVELLVSMMILSIVLGGITSVVISTLRVEQTQQQLQEVVDDGRLSMTRIRQELRAARRIYEGSGGDRLRFWVDQNQDALVQPEEQICYVVQPVDGSNRWRIVRWSHAEDPGDCTPTADPPAGQTARTVAATLVDPAPFVELSPPPGGIADPPTREVSILLDLQVDAGRGPDSIQVEGNIRLRNVP
jgi:prepilin-type N-terminal cleavage/methylation domain-containing protein